MYRKRQTAAKRWALREQVQAAPCSSMRPMLAPCAGQACGRDGPAPSITTAPCQANRGRPGWLVGGVITMWDTRHTRKPMLLLRLSGWLCLRLAARRFWVLLFQEPPRSTRVAPRLPHGPVRPPLHSAPDVGSKVKKIRRRCAARSGQRASFSAFSAPVTSFSMGDTRHTRKPMLKSRSPGRP
jgi:hypothetical protein